MWFVEIFPLCYHVKMSKLTATVKKTSVNKYQRMIKTIVHCDSWHLCQVVNFTSCLNSVSDIYIPQNDLKGKKTIISAGIIFLA